MRLLAAREIEDSADSWLIRPALGNSCRRYAEVPLDCRDSPPSMASAVLASRNKPNWLQHKGVGVGFMGKYLTFNITSCTKKELNELKSRLVLELEQIRRLKSRIESGEFPPRPSFNGPLKKSASKNKNKKNLWK